MFSLAGYSTPLTFDIVFNDPLVVYNNERFWTLGNKLKVTEESLLNQMKSVFRITETNIILKGETLEEFVSSPFYAFVRIILISKQIAFVWN